MTWPWGKLFKECKLGEQKLFFAFWKKKEKAIMFQRCRIYAAVENFTWLGVLLHMWSYHFQLRR